jgi:UDP-glucose 4-epimerase
MEVVIIRPPLVYGPGVKANFLSIMRWLHKGIPLPLGSIHNHRSLVALPNLIDLITTCIDHPAAANQTFLVSDGEDLSTTALLRRLGDALGKPARLLPIPQAWLETTLTGLGKRAIAQRLCGSLQIDLSHTRNTLGWTPPVSVDEALRQTAAAYLQAQLYR